MFIPPETWSLLAAGLELPNTGNPIVDRWIDIIVIGLTAAGALVLAYTKLLHPHVRELMEELADLRRNVQQVKRDSQVIREQTENSHKDAPHPNLRDNIDANAKENAAGFASLHSLLDSTSEAIASIDQAVKGLGVRLTNLEDGLSSLRADVSSDRSALRMLDDRFNTHVRDKQDLPVRIAALEEGRIHSRKEEE